MPVRDPYIESTREQLLKKGILLPSFPQFEPDAEPFTVALLQPKAEIAAAPTGIKNANHALAVEKVRRFMNYANEQHASVCITPEYCCPWEVINEIIVGQIQVPEQAIWILGCEAISIEELRRREDGAPQGIVWLFEAPEPHLVPGQMFLDPLCIVMHGTRQATSEPVLVVVVQFKTEPMGGYDFEQQNMIRGACIYELKNPGDYSIRLVCLLCSDVLQHAEPKFQKLQTYFRQQHRILLLHLQLNTEPRHDLYRPYREMVLQRCENRQIIALNWAQNIEIRNVEQEDAFVRSNNPSMSAVYSRRWKLKTRDEAEIDECERRGIYFCYSNSLRSTVAILNFREYVFLLRLSKVCQEAAANYHQTYSPPQVGAISKWDCHTNVWVPETIPVDTDAQPEIADCHLDLTPFGNVFDHPGIFERLAALSLGELGLRENVRQSTWPEFDSVKAYHLDVSETIRRTTFAQDPCQDARQLRRYRYQTLVRFNAVRTSGRFPKRMSPFLHHDVRFEFELPYSNLRAADGRPGTGIYVHSGNEDDAKQLYTRVLKHLQLLNEGRVDKDHVVIWYLGPPEADGQHVIGYPPDATPHMTDHPTPKVNSISSEP